MIEQDPEIKNVKESPYERFRAARRWLWSTLTDEAVLVYRRSAHGKDRIRVIQVELFLFIREVIAEFFYRVEGTARAASLAYTTLLSLIPLMVAFSQLLGGYFKDLLPNLEIETLLNSVVPYRSPQIASNLRLFTENAKTASTFGVIVFLFVSFRLFMAVEATINQIWKIPSARGYRQQLRAFTMLLFWGPLLMTLSFTTQTSLEKNPYLHSLVQNDFILGLVPVVVLFIAFTMMFWLVPSTKVQFKAAALGAFITSLLFSLVRWGFGIYAESLFNGRLNVIYGTLGLVIIFLLSLELMWIVILLGVEISYVFQNLRGVLRASEKHLVDEPKYNLYFGLRALVEVTRCFEGREGAPSSYRMAEDFGSTDRQMNIVLRKLEGQHLIKQIAGEWPGFVPGCDPDKILVEEVVDVMEGGSREIPERETTDQPTVAISDIFDTLRDSTRESLQRLSVGQLVRRLYGSRFPSRAAEVDEGRRERGV